MNKLHAIITGLLLIAVGYLLIQNCCQKSCTNNASGYTNAVDSTSLINTPKLAFLNVDTLNEKYLFVIDEEKKLQDKETALTLSIERKVKALEKRLAVLNEKAPTMLNSEIQAAQIELQEKEMQIQEERQRSAEKLQLATIQAQERFQKKVRNYLKHVADSMNLTAIFSNNQQGAALYSTEQLDITNIVVSELNKAYTKEQEK